MSTTYNINWDFIHEQEGNSKTEAYVPVCTPSSVANKLNKICYGKKEGSVIGKSGVTIAAGFDLGQRNTYDLNQLKLPKHLKDILKEFLGLKKEDAVKALEKYQEEHGGRLMITSEDAKIINQAVKAKTLTTLSRNFDNESSTKFSDLPTNVQTALASFAFQYGENMNTHTSEYVQQVWHAYTKQDYEKLVKLLDGAPAYNGRRRLESELIKNRNK